MNNAKTEAKNELKDVIIDRALTHVVFDGWSELTLKKVICELNLSEVEMRKMFPRGGVDMALAFHERDDKKFLKEFSVSKFNHSDKRIRDRIESAINCRLDISANNKEAVKRSISLLTTPVYFSEASKAVWNTSDKIWISIQDKSDSLNWYSKRLLLSSVYSAAIIFWIEDDSVDFVETRAFVSRRINDVMAIERIKGVVKNSPGLGGLLQQLEDGVDKILRGKENFPGWH